jgi:Skp family chaperone for outer membrane proteins
MTQQESDAIVGRVFREHKAAKEQLARIESEINRAKSQIQSFLTVDLNNLDSATLPECLTGATVGKLIDEHKRISKEVARLQSDLSKF